MDPSRTGQTIQHNDYNKNGPSRGICRQKSWNSTSMHGTIEPTVS
jgi:hypothetical protein